MFISFLQRLAAGIRAAVSRRNSRRNLGPMLMLDDHLLRDIGLTRADVIASLSTPADPNAVDFLDARRRRNASTADRPAQAGRRLAA